MTREDFIFTIGYKGDTAIVDASAQNDNKKPSSGSLLKKGLYRAAFCAALFDESTDDQEAVAYALGQKTGREYSSDSLKRLFGVYQIPDWVKRVEKVG